MPAEPRRGLPTRAWLISVADDDAPVAQVSPAVHEHPPDPHAWRLFLEVPDSPSRNENHEGHYRHLRQLVEDFRPAEIYLWSSSERTYIKVAELPR